MARILIIDDDKDICTLLRRVLESQGHHVTAALNGQQGLIAARERPELIICDVTMPIMGGHAVLSALRANKITAEIPFIFLSGTDDRETIRKSMNLGGDDFISKPAPPDDIIQTVDARLKRRHQQQQRQEEAVKKAIKLFSGIVDDLGTPKAAIHWLADQASVTEELPTKKAIQTNPAGCFLASNQNRKYFVKLSEIKALIANGEYTKAFWGKDQSMMFRKPLKQWKAELKPQQFVRVHRHAIINLAFIAFIEKQNTGQLQVHIQDFKEIILVSQREKAAFNRSLTAYQRSLTVPVNLTAAF